MNVFFAGRLVDFKDPITFVKAARLLSTNRPEPLYQFLIAGDGVLLKECTKLASGYSNISILGWVEPEEVDELMSKTDVFCQLSPYENLWASSLICAMKHSKAVICTDVGYTSKYLTHKYQAFMIPPRNHVALAEAIDTLASDNQMRQTLGRNAYDFVQENLSVEKITYQIRQLLLNSLQASEDSSD